MPSEPKTCERCRKAPVGYELLDYCAEQFLDDAASRAAYEEVVAAYQALSEPPSTEAQLRALLHESLFHLRLDDAAQAYHNKAMEALARRALNGEAPDAQS